MSYILYNQKQLLACSNFTAPSTLLLGVFDWGAMTFVKTTASLSQLRADPKRTAPHQGRTFSLDTSSFDASLARLNSSQSPDRIDGDSLSFIFNYRWYANKTLTKTRRWCARRVSRPWAAQSRSASHRCPPSRDHRHQHPRRRCCRSPATPQHPHDGHANATIKYKTRFNL